MKKIYTLILLLVSASLINAQGFVFTTPSTITANGTASEFELIAKATLVNNTANAMTLTIVSKKISAPSIWEFSICETYAGCQLTNLDSFDFTIPANSSTSIDLHYYPKNTPGTANRDITVFAKSNPSYSVKTTVITRAFGVATTDLVKPILNIYPNPVVDNITIQLPSNHNSIGKVEVYNILGKVVMSKTFDPRATKLQFDVENLPKGNYIIKYVNNKQEVLTKSFQKI